MNRNYFSKRAYLAPRLELIPVRIERSLLATSVSGGHNDAEDDEELNAKHNSLFDEKGFSCIGFHPWEEY